LTTVSNWLSNRFENRLYRVYKHSTGCQTRLTTVWQNGCIVYTAGCQTVFVKPVVQPGMTTGLTTGCIHDTAVLSNRLSNGFDSRLNVCIHDTTGSQTGLTTSLTRLSNRLSDPFDNRFNKRLYRVYKHSTSCQVGLKPVWQPGWMFVYTIQPVVIPVVQPVWQSVVWCKRVLRGMREWLLFQLQNC